MFATDTPHFSMKKDYNFKLLIGFQSLPLHYYMEREKVNCHLPWGINKYALHNFSALSMESLHKNYCKSNPIRINTLNTTEIYYRLYKNSTEGLRLPSRKKWEHPSFQQMPKTSLLELRPCQN